MMSTLILVRKRWDIVISTVFDFDISDEEFIMVKASAKKVGKWADDLTVKFPKDFNPTAEQYHEILDKAVEELRKVQDENA